MPYKKNILRLKREAISRKRSKQGKYGNEVKRRMMHERAEPMEVVGSMRTDGIFGDHLIELLHCGDEEYLWVRVDGSIRRPKTLAGVRRTVADWIWRKIEWLQNTK